MEAKTAIGGTHSRNRERKTSKKTPAAKWNTAILRHLKESLDKDPEADLTTLIPGRYRDKLLNLKNRR